MHYRVHSMKAKPGCWYPTKAGAIATFERACKRKGISPPERYPPGVSGDSITNNDIAYPRHTSAAGMREGHGTVYVDARNDVGMRHQYGQQASTSRVTGANFEGNCRDSPEALSGIRCGLDREAKSRSWLCPAADAGTLTNPSVFAFTLIDHLKDKEKPREYAQRKHCFR